MSWRRASDVACPTVERIIAANRDHALALCLEATERGDHALAQWIGRQIEQTRTRATADE